MASTNKNYPESDPCHHARNIKGMLDEVARHCREDVGRLDDPKAKAMFETTAEVLRGLITAYDHYEQGAEQAFRG